MDYRELQYSAASGVYVLPDPKDARLWHGAVSVRHGAYKGGLFRFRLTLPAEHPAEGAYPDIRFEDPVFHPLVHPTVRARAVAWRVPATPRTCTPALQTGQLQLRDRFPTWQADSSVVEAVNYTKGIFYQRSGEYGTPVPLNGEALDL